MRHLLSMLGLPQDEYRRQRDSVTDIYYERVRAVLPDEQFGKWYDYYRRKEAQRAASQNNQ